MPQGYLNLAMSLMDQFAERTGLSPARVGPKRYLWTDAFAVCTFLELERLTGLEKYYRLASDLVGQVHAVLGRHREDDPRTNWISGLSEEEGRRHPTAGGLRIGKPLNERRPGEPLDERLEWERDGQYFHYLTKWTQALGRFSRRTERSDVLHWAMELAVSAQRAFTASPGPGQPKRMYWKMSIDLSRPLVPSMGQHDPLDGLMACLQLMANHVSEQDTELSSLDGTYADLAGMAAWINPVTEDPLGIGGLLQNALIAGRLVAEGQCRDTALPALLVEAATSGLNVTAREQFVLPAASRLAFRELGLSIGLKAVPRLQGILDRNTDSFASSTRLKRRLEELMHELPLACQIEDFWIKAESREVPAWQEHLDINTVMLAASVLGGVSPSL